MTIEEAKSIRIADYLHSLGYSPVKQQGINLWYKSPFREESEASFKVNTEREQWYDFGLGKGGNIIALAAHLYATDHVPYILKRIAEQTPVSYTHLDVYKRQGIRSEKESYDWMASEFDMNIIPLELTDPYNYHLDCTIFPLTRESIIVATEAFTKQEIKQLENVAELIPISIEQAHTGLCNSVRVNNYILNASDIDFLSKRSEDYRLEKSKNIRLEDIAGQNGMEVCYFNMEEYLKGGGLLSCTVLHMNHHSFTKDLL